MWWISLVCSVVCFGVRLAISHQPGAGQWMTQWVSHPAAYAIWPVNLVRGANIWLGKRSYTLIHAELPSWGCWISWVFSVISRSWRDSVGGTSSSRIFPGSPKADAIRAIFRDLHLREVNSLPHIQWYSWVETHISDEYDKSRDLLRKNHLSLKFPQFREFSLQFRETWRSRAISGDSRKFRETWQVCTSIWRW